ncbi:MAG: S-layer homology domain-containing protein, partial [Clostridiales bacterium]|jgi:hypothetical protein|nr:S-layer homology domain-containing protein [Clostridiales bacterium]
LVRQATEEEIVPLLNQYAAVLELSQSNTDGLQYLIAEGFADALAGLMAGERPESVAALDDILNVKIALARLNTIENDHEKALWTLRTYRAAFGFDSESLFAQYDVSEYNRSLILKSLLGNGYRMAGNVKTDFFAGLEKYKPAVKNNPSGSRGASVSGVGAVADAIALAEQKNAQPIADAPVFRDLDAAAWAAESITALCKRGILSGDGDGRFRPDDFITREEFVKIAVGAFSLERADAEADFADLDRSAWYYRYIAAAVAANLVMGDSAEENTFGIGRGITREDMAVILYRAAVRFEVPLAGEAARFGDFDTVSAYARDAVAALSGAGVVNGVSGGDFAPRQFATRAMAAKMVYELAALCVE